MIPDRINVLVWSWIKVKSTLIRFSVFKSCTNRADTPILSPPYKAAIQTLLHNTAHPRISQYLHQHILFCSHIWFCVLLSL